MKTKHALIVLMVLLPLALLTFLSNGGSLSLEPPAAAGSVALSGQQEDRDQEGEQATVDQQQETGSVEEPDRAEVIKEKCRELLEQAKQYRDQDNFDEAIKTYEEAYKLCSDAAALYFIADILDIEMNQYKDALMYFEQFMDAAANSNDKDKDYALTRMAEIREGMQAFEKGQSLFAEEKYDEAIKEFQKAFESTPHAIHAANIARCYEKLAIESYESFIAYIALKPAAKAPLRDEQEQDVRQRLATLKAFSPLIP